MAAEWEKRFIGHRSPFGPGGEPLSDAFWKEHIRVRMNLVCDSTSAALAIVRYRANYQLDKLAARTLRKIDGCLLTIHKAAEDARKSPS